MNQKNATGGNADAIPSGIQGICPNGWHLPSKAEWKKLENFVADELAPVEGNVWTDDERYTHLVGKMLELPLCNRQIPVVAAVMCSYVMFMFFDLN